uniref:GCS light chain n=1 Tax=Eptatretus burgeri TaxID=7764 RepID=A0A8C4R4F8_EPTBU
MFGFFYTILVFLFSFFVFSFLLQNLAKVFLLQNQPRALKEAIEKVSEALGVAHLDTVMMALPPTSLENDPLNEHLKASWLELQQLVAAGSIASLGTSDLDVSQLETLYHWAEVKPVSNQVNLASCCVMPPELTAFAKKFDIQLLTHNDAADILPAAAFESAVGDALNIPAAGWTPVWVLRYSVVIKCRGVIKCKGFLVGAWRHL